LYDTTADGIYRLLPRGGTLEHIKEFMGILPVPTRIPVIETPSPESTATPAS